MLKNLFARLRKTKSISDIKISKEARSFTEFEEKGKGENEV